MFIVYRACSTGNPNKNRPIEGDKIDLVRACFGSFKEAFKGVKYDLVCLLDKPTPELREIFKDEETEESHYAYFAEGNVGSFHRQIELALERGKCYMFIEDDYFFLPGSGKILEKAVQELPFLTPYDHPRYYDEKTHEYPREVILSAGHHWQSVISTTLTFGGGYGELVKEADTMRKHGWADHSMWVDITGRRKLYSPIPTLASHMETEHLSPKWALLQTPTL